MPARPVKLTPYLKGKYRRSIAFWAKVAEYKLQDAAKLQAAGQTRLAAVQRWQAAMRCDAALQFSRLLAGYEWDTSYIDHLIGLPDPIASFEVRA